jgi:glycine cleavage system H protein
MASIRGCNLPEDLYYQIEKHVWAKPLDSGLVRVGMTAVAAILSGGKLTAITVKAKNIGQEVKQGKSLATIESSNSSGRCLRRSAVLVRERQVTADPNLAISDPTVAGSPRCRRAAGTRKSGLAGTEGLAAYQAKLEAENISCT